MTKMLLMVVACGLFIGCDAQQSDSTSTSDPKPKGSNMEVEAGVVYATKNDDGKFGINKILVVDEHAVHVRFYNEKYDELPKEISTAELTFLVGHAPVARQGFIRADQHLIKIEKVSEDELEGYRLYQQGMLGR